MSELYFRLDKVKGFTGSDSADRNEGYAIPIRELLQNSLDASRQANNAKCEIDIYIEKIPTTKIPCLDGYKLALEKTIATQKRKASYGQNSQQEVEFIKDELGKSHIDVLMFVDNGKGMNASDGIGGIGGLFDERSSGKDVDGDGPLGSFGVGHLTSYMLSSLRYVLYATKYEESGEVKNLFTGSPILAGHVDENPPAERSGSGRIVRKKPKPGDEHMPVFDYPDEFPDFIAPKMQKINTGTLVAILGLSDEWGDEAEYAIASNFFHAIANDKLSVTIHSENGEKRIDSEKAEILINANKESKSARGDNILSGKAVYHCWHNVKNAKPIEIPLDRKNTVAVYIKKDVDADSTVALVRNGMLIARHDSMQSSRINSLRKSSEYESFTMVIDLNHQYAPDFFALVKGAENKNHNKLVKSKSKQRVGELQKFFNALIEEIKRQELLPKMVRDHFDLPIFVTMEEADAIIAAGGTAVGQGGKAHSTPAKPSTHVSKKKSGAKKDKKQKSGTPPVNVNRSSDSIYSKRCIDNDETLSMVLIINKLEKDDKDEVYLSVRLAGDDDEDAVDAFLKFKSVECNGESINLPAKQEDHPICLGDLKNGGKYKITAVLEKPANLVGTRVPLLPVLGLKRKTEKKIQGESHA